MTLWCFFSWRHEFRMQRYIFKRSLENERSIVLLWWSEVGEVDCPELTGIKSRLLAMPV